MENINGDQETFSFHTSYLQDSTATELKCAS